MDLRNKLAEWILEGQDAVPPADVASPPPLPSEVFEQAAQRRGQAVALRMIRGTYDAAQTTDENAYHWQGVDALSADRANSYSVRKTVRERSRYELSNNSFLRGIIDIHGNYIVGTGPRLQMLEDEEKQNSEIEKRWTAHCERIRLARKLRTIQMARDGDGEGFALLYMNSALPAEQLDVQPFECDRVTSNSMTVDPRNVDGVILDENDNPVKYRIRKAHPGGAGISGFGESDAVDAEWVLHWFRQFRAEQHRGVPTTMPALPLMAILRRFILATLGTAEGAANVGGILQTDAPPGGEPDAGQAFDLIPTARNMLMTLPYGWNLNQYKAEHPTTEHERFVRSIMTECARPWSMPVNIAMGDSSRHNFASGRLDQRTYFTFVGIEQHDMGLRLVDQIFRKWLPEAKLFYEFGDVPEQPAHQWMWDAPEPVDKAKTAKANAAELKTGQTTIPELWAARGRDWRPALERGAEAYGVSIEEYKKLLVRGTFGNTPGQAATEAAEAAAEATVEEMLEELSRQEVT